MPYHSINDTERSSSEMQTATVHPHEIAVSSIVFATYPSLLESLAVGSVPTPFLPLTASAVVACYGASSVVASPPAVPFAEAVHNTATLQYNCK